MRFEVRVSAAAEQDVIDAVDWYESEQNGLGSSFLNALDLEFELLSRSPFFPIRFDSVRCVPLRQFPYLIYFRVDEDESRVLILAILHTARRSPNP